MLFIMKKTLASIESFTGGLFASEIVKKPGASSFFKGSIVVYSNEIKEKLGIDVSNGVINKETALAMALAGKKFFNVDYCVSFTGNAGPSTMENKKVGLVYMAINDKVYEKQFRFKNRNWIRKKSVKFILKKIKKC